MPEIAMFKCDNEKGPYRLDIDKLQGALLTEDIRETPVIAISVIGEHRSAKGVLMNAINAFVKKKDSTGVVRLSNAEMYLHSKEEAQHGPGCRIWEVHPKDVNNKKAILMLLVSQVSIIDEGRPNETKSILAMVSCLSSINILNVKEKLKDADLLRAKEILEYSSSFHSEQRFMIAIEKYGGMEDAKTYFEEIIEEKIDDSQTMKDTKKFLREKGVKCFGFPDSKCERDPEKLPDLDPDFLTKVTDFVKNELSNEVFDQCLHSGAMTGKEFFRYAEEMNREVLDRSITDFEPDLFKKVVRRTKGMLQCESAFEERLRQASCDTLADVSRLCQLEKEAEKAAHETADKSLVPTCWTRVSENNKAFFKEFERVGRLIRDAVKPLHLEKYRRRPCTSGLRTQHPEDEKSDSRSDCSEREHIDNIEDGPVGSSKRSRKRRLINSPRKHRTLSNSTH